MRQSRVGSDEQFMKTVYAPKDCKPRPLTHDEIVRVDAFSMGPADFYEQRHARYDRERMRKILERELPVDKQRLVGALQEFNEELYELEKHGRNDVGSLALYEDAKQESG